MCACDTLDIVDHTVRSPIIRVELLCSVQLSSCHQTPGERRPLARTMPFCQDTESDGTAFFIVCVEKEPL
jgi:hypothetical protein